MVVFRTLASNSNPHDSSIHPAGQRARQKEDVHFRGLLGHAHGDGISSTGRRPRSFGSAERSFDYRRFTCTIVQVMTICILMAKPPELDAVEPSCTAEEHSRSARQSRSWMTPLWSGRCGYFARNKGVLPRIPVTPKNRPPDFLVLRMLQCREGFHMKSKHEVHPTHPHAHGNGCAHEALKHNGYTD